jgi:hypothetical protein
VAGSIAETQNDVQTLMPIPDRIFTKGPVHNHLLMTLSRYRDIIMISVKNEESKPMKTLRSLLNPFRTTGRRGDRYYQGVIGEGAGYPTYDEARRDLLNRDRSVNSQGGWR